MAKKIISARMQQRQDTRAAWEAANPVLLNGEIGFLSDDLTRYKVGDGVTEWNRLPYRGSGSGEGSGGGSVSVDTELSLTSNNPVSNAEISKNIGVRVVEADIATKDGFNQVIEVLVGKGESLGAIIPVLCLLNGQPVFVKGMGALGGLGYLLADGLKRYFVTEVAYCEYPFTISDSEDKWENNEIAIFFYLLLNDKFPNAFNDAIIELGGMRHPINSIESKSGYVEIKTTIGNEVRTYKLALTVDFGDLGVPTLIDTEYIGSGGGSITVDSELSPTSPNPVQNKVITEALSDKVNSRFLYVGDTQEECEYNLETMRLLDEGFTGCLCMAGTGEDPATIFVTAYMKEEGQWRLPLSPVHLTGASDMYLYFEESGRMSINLQDSFYATLSVNKNADTEHVKKVISHYTDYYVTHMDLVTIAKMLPHSDGALYTTWECEFDSGRNPLRVYASYNKGGLNHIDVFDLDGSLITTVALPLTLDVNGSNDDYVALSEYGKLLILKGDFVVYSSFSYHQPLSVKFADENNELIFYITILNDLEFVTYRLAPDGGMTFSSKTSLTTTN